MQNKTYIITGGSSGIGLQCAIDLSSKGANLILIGRDESKLQLAAQKLECKVSTYAFDLKNTKEILSLVEDIYEKHSKIDGFIHCAGASVRKRFKDLNNDTVNDVMSINFYSFVEFLRALSIKKSKADKLATVCISSHASSSNEKFLLAYAASKAALESSVRILSNELRTKNITVSCIRPAFVDTPFIASMNSIYDSFEQYLKDSNYQPYGLIPPKVISSMICELLSENAGYYSGAIIDIPAGANN